MLSVPPQIAPFDFGDEPANVGEVAMIVCMVAKGDLPLDMFWSLNHVPIQSGEQGFRMLRMNARSSTLSIDSLHAAHRGMYSCVARNKAGFAEFHAELQVNGYCPTRPVIFAVFMILLVVPFLFVISSPCFLSTQYHQSLRKLLRSILATSPPTSARWPWYRAWSPRAICRSICSGR